MNPWTPFHRCANISNRRWHTEVWCNGHTLRSSSNATVSPWHGKSVGQWVILSALSWMWSAHLFYQSLSPLRNSSNLHISSSRNSTFSVYRIARKRQEHHSTPRAAVYIQYSWKWDKWDTSGAPSFSAWSDYVPSATTPTLIFQIHNRRRLPSASSAPPIACGRLQPWERRTGRLSLQSGLQTGLTATASHREMWDTSRRLYWPSLEIF